MCMQTIREFETSTLGFISNTRGEILDTLETSSEVELEDLERIILCEVNEYNKLCKSVLENMSTSTYKESIYSFRKIKKSFKSNLAGLYFNLTLLAEECGYLNKRDVRVTLNKHLSMMIDDTKNFGNLSAVV